ncbi:MFS transporter [Treponema vincentii]|uniref:MFS transporter n=1 Tax=Treponema TaxID=157 RepID=UPI001BB07954|nr:MFS transporter [Treponema vincentii]QUY18808.1 MFS transporter [Treponema vincentii]
MEKSMEQPLILRRGVPYFLLFSLYAIINTYLPIMLRTLGFSTAQIGILLGIIEIVGVCAPFFITRQLDKTGRYGLIMCIFGFDIALLLLPILRFHSFFVTALCLGIFAVGFKGMVPVLDGFTTKALGQHNAQYGKIRALGSVGFVGMNLFLQLHPSISGKNPVSMILAVSIVALMFVVTLRWVPDLYASLLVETGTPMKTEEATLKESTEGQSVKEKVAFAAFPKLFWECLLLIFLAFLGLVPCQRFFSLYVEEYIKVEASAGLWALSAMAEIPLLIISGKLIRRFGKERLLAVCLLSVIIRNCCYIFIPGISGAVVGQLLHSLSFGLFHPLGVLLCVVHSYGKTVTAMTFFTAANGIAYVIGSMVGGYVIECLGYPALFLLFSVFPAIGIVFYLFIMRHGC